MRTPALWGQLLSNNNPGPGKLDKDEAVQQTLCQHWDDFQRENAQWAQNGCVLQDPQTDIRACHWVCPEYIIGGGIGYYCGTFEAQHHYGPYADPVTGRGYCEIPSGVPIPNKNAGPPCDGAGNPIHPGYGNKYQEESDYIGAGTYPLRFVRAYNSKRRAQEAAVGAHWRSTFDRNLTPTIGIDIATVYAYRSDGKVLFFTLMKNGVTVPIAPLDPTAAWSSDADTTDKLTRLVDGAGNTTGWTYYVADTEEWETYDAAGRLLVLTSRSGNTQSLAYDAQGRLATVTDAFGRQLSFQYNVQNRISTMVDAALASYQYAYDASGNLSSVTYPDSTVRRYWYNEPAFTQSTNLPNALTGITDELGNRFATFAYDAQGNAVSTEHAGGVDKYSVAYGSGISVVTDPIGTNRTYSFTTLFGVVKNAGISQPCSSCGGASSSAITYDANGNAGSRTDFNNKKVCYAYDLSRNLETARVEGLLAAENCAASLATPPARPDVRKTATTWDAAYRLPATITEPAPGGTKTTTFTYDTSGNLTQKTIVAPKNDGTGATVTRTWAWTYATLGRVLTATVRTVRSRPTPITPISIRIWASAATCKPSPIRPGMSRRSPRTTPTRGL